jgi:hypothetical protein
MVRHGRGRGAGKRGGGRGSRSRRRAHRSVSHRAQPRARRHGRGVPRGAGRRAVPAAGRHQAGPARSAVTSRSGPAEARTPDPGDARSSEHRASVRRRHDCRRHAIYRHGVRRRRAYRHLLRLAVADDRTAAAVVQGDLLRCAPRAPEPDRASRPQAVEHPGCARRYAEAARFRHRQTPRRSPDDAHNGGYAGRLPRSNARSCEPGTDPRRSNHHGERHVCAWRSAV